LSHDSLDGRMLGDRVAETGFTGTSTLGENIAQGQTTAEEVMAGWMASRDHCTNIMNERYHLLGIGYATDTAHGPYWTQDFAGAI
jgi:uncharacterized protein YkwD